MRRRKRNKKFWKRRLKTSASSYGEIRSIDMYIDKPVLEFLLSPPRTNHILQRKSIQNNFSVPPNTAYSCNIISFASERKLNLITATAPLVKRYISVDRLIFFFAWRQKLDQNSQCNTVQYNIRLDRIQSTTSWWLFTSRARILRECSKIHSPPALFFF